MRQETSQVLSKVFEVLRQEGVRKADIAAELALTVDELNALTFMLTLSSVSSGTDEEAIAGSTPRVAKLRLVR